MSDAKLLVTDVVVVGGGIAGSSIAYSLASAGLGVTVLEATGSFDDRVRGETMQPWGVSEAQRLGVDQVLLDAGAHVNRLVRHYVVGTAAPDELPLRGLVDGVDGSLNLTHPAACQALIHAAAGAGATVFRGVADVDVSPGASPTVAFGDANGRHELQASLVIGADGRASTVRRQIGITLEHQAAVGSIAGLLLDDLDDVPDDFDILAAGAAGLFVLFHQGGGRARAYVCSGSGLRRFAGADRLRAFLSACESAPVPWAASVGRATPAGPVKSYAGDDTWTSMPAVEGVVLVGDAAGHNDPVIAQGLSIAMRDARMVRDLVLDGARGPAGFGPYAEERIARMERLRFVADVVATAYVEDAPNREDRRAYLAGAIAGGDAEIMALLLGVFAGPELIPADLLRPELLDRIRTR